MNLSELVYDCYITLIVGSVLISVALCVLNMVKTQKETEKLLHEAVGIIADSMMASIDSSKNNSSKIFKDCNAFLKKPEVVDVLVDKKPNDS